jgi:hypothetical protein
VISDAVNRPAPRIISAIEDLARQLHPDAFVEKPENLNEKSSKEKTEREKDKNEKAAPAPIQPPPSPLSLLSSGLQYNTATLGGCACAR